jgi:hypothetical protein
MNREFFFEARALKMASGIKESLIYYYDKARLVLEEIRKQYKSSLSSSE